MPKEGEKEERSEGDPRGSTDVEGRRDRAVCGKEVLEVTRGEGEGDPKLGGG